MVNKNEDNGRCGSCPEVNGIVWQGFVYCQYLRCDVYADSLKCQHGHDLDDVW